MSPCNFICLLKPKCGKLIQIEVRLDGFGGKVVLLLFCIFLYDLQKAKGASVSILHAGGMYSFTNTFMFRLDSNIHLFREEMGVCLLALFILFLMVQLIVQICCYSPYV